MANEEANPAAEAGNEDGLEAIRLIVADDEPIFRVGVRKIVALEDDIRIVAQVETADAALTAVRRFNADVVLLTSTICDSPIDTVSALLAAVPSLKIVLVMNEPTEEATVELMRRGASGIVSRSIAPDMLVRCMRKVHEGEAWLDSKGVNWVIEAYRAQAAQLTSPQSRVKLSQKELRIISGVTQGLRNKDIAQDVGTTEQVVKNYLRKVYDKLGVSDRLELALYCMHHHLLENYSKSAAEAAAPPSSEELEGAASGEEVGQER
jgi:DNA-binding NarL/FixJ family response regulator